MSSNNQGRKSHNNSRRNKVTIVSVSLRRQKVAELLQTTNMTNCQIAQVVNVDPSVITDDIHALKNQAVDFLYDLCKGDLCFFYRQTILDIDHARHECWKLYNTDANNKKVTTKDRIQTLRTIIQADVARFELLSKGELVMSVKSLNERIEAIKLNQSQVQTSQQPQTQQRTPVV